MKQLLWTYTCIILLLPALDSETVTWTYSGKTGMANWGGECNKKQKDNYYSPIDIIVNETTTPEFPLPPLTFSNAYSVIRNVTLTNNGNTVNLRFPDDDAEMVNVTMEDEGTFYLVSIIFHWGHTYTEGSEHHIDSKEYAMEVQFIHEPSQHKSNTKEFNLAVLFEVGLKDNPNYAPIINQLHKVIQPNSSVHFNLTSLKDLLPKNVDAFFFYQGTQTIPPCTPGVKWVVFTEAVQISEMQRFNLWKLLDANNEKMSTARRGVMPRIDMRSVQYRSSTCVNSVCIMCLWLSFAFWVIL